jgi:histidine triad (HIT) family protein
VPHVHVHLIPLHSMANATFQHKESLSPDQFEAVAQKIRSRL